MSSMAVRHIPTSLRVTSMFGVLSLIFPEPNPMSDVELMVADEL
jgi:hypothetical protein